MKIQTPEYEIETDDFKIIVKGSTHVLLYKNKEVLTGDLTKCMDYIKKYYKK